MTTNSEDDNIEVLSGLDAGGITDGVGDERSITDLVEQPAHRVRPQEG